MLAAGKFFKKLILGEGERESESESRREREGEGEKEFELLFHLFMYSFVASCMCPDWGLNLQP